MTTPACDVAIVGGGASGTLLTVQLLRSGRWRRILLVDRAGDFGRGIAYRSEDPAHLLNVPAARMSALPEQPDHFLTWLCRHDPAAGPETYARRRLYGDYLTELLADAETASAGTLQRCRAEVREVAEVADGLRLGLDPGPLSEVVARHTVLALGNFPPAPLPASPAALPRVWQSPWPREAVWPDADAAVLLVGAGLSAVDLILSLAARGHRGPVRVLSRHGLFPLSHHLPTSPALELRDLPHGRVRPLLHALRKLAERAPDWRTVVDGLRPLSRDLWRALDDVERRRFARHPRTLWEVHRHRLAPQVAAELEGLLRSGRVRIDAGRLLGLDLVDQRLVARLRPRGASREDRWTVDLAVNCTGPVGHARNADRLVADLLRRGLARSGPVGLGLSTDANGAVLDAAGHATGKLWGLGPVRRGDQWESTAVPEIRAMAAALAEQLGRQERQPTPPAG